MKFIETVNDFIGLFIIGVIIVCIALFIQNGYNNLTYVTSKVDDRRYLVRNMKDRQAAADMLATINQKLEKLKVHLEKKYPNDDRIKRLQTNYVPENVCESTSHDNNTSYSVNKGEKVVFCIRSKENDKLEDLNTLTFVAIHEMGHLASGTVGHNQEFWDNFEFLLREATSIGLYEKVEYSKHPKSYCGIQITDSPIE
jgi:predicted metal-dependent hydrolase